MEQRTHRQRDNLVEQHHRWHMEIKHKVLKEKYFAFSFALRNVASFKANSRLLTQFPGSSAYLVVIGTVRALLHACVLLLVAHLNANNRVHVESGQLSRFDDRHTDLEVLGLEVVVEFVQLHLRLVLLAGILVVLLTFVELGVVLGDVVVLNVIVARHDRLNTSGA